MKKRFVKLAAVLASSVMAIGLAGCNLTQNTSEVASTGMPDPEAVSDLTPGSVTTEPDTMKPAEDADFMKFLNGEQKALCSNLNAYGLMFEQEYSYEEFKAAINEALADDFNETGMEIQNVSYGFIDCGNDGVSEMAIAVSANNKYGYNPMTEYYILCKMNGYLMIVDSYESYYRSMGSLNKYGVYNVIGSGGAALSIASFERVNAEGYHEFIYSCETEFGRGEPIIDGYRLPSYADLPEGYPDYSEDFAENILEIYHFMEADPMMDVDSELSDEYVVKNVYVFKDANGGEMFPSEEYRKLYDSLGIKITNENGIRELIRDRLNELGISDKEMVTPEESADTAVNWVMFEEMYATEG